MISLPKKEKAMTKQEWTDNSWLDALRDELGFEPRAWDGIDPSRDQMIGLVRSLEDGSDPFAADRSSSAMAALQVLGSRRVPPRDPKDGELAGFVDSDSWVYPPGHALRALQFESPAEAYFGDEPTGEIEKLGLKYILSDPDLEGSE
jgi:hypothetical protein